jgi:hypothetical protein
VVILVLLGLAPCPLKGVVILVLLGLAPCPLKGVIFTEGNRRRKLFRHYHLIKLH